MKKKWYIIIERTLLKEELRLEIDLLAAGHRIKQIRKKHNYSMATFAKLIGNSSASTVNNWEKGNNLPNKERLEKIAILGNTTVNWIRYGTFSEYLTQLLNTAKLKQPLTQQQFQKLSNLLQKKQISYTQDLDILYLTKEQFPFLFETEYPSFNEKETIDMIAENTFMYSVEKNHEYRKKLLPLLETLHQNKTNWNVYIPLLEKSLTFLLTQSTKKDSNEIISCLKTTIEKQISQTDLQ